MKISINQPAYLPWLGYFQRIKSSDLFIFLDNVQFEKNSYVNRNRIKTPQGTLWLTVPLNQKGHMEKELNSIEINDKNNWRSKHLKSIALNYSRTLLFQDRFARLSKFNESQISNIYIADLCWQQLNFWTKELNINTPLIRASEHKFEGRKSDLVLSICKYFQANEYISGINGEDYLKRNEFVAEGINITLQNYNTKEYKQLWGDFIPNLSIVDSWMNCKDIIF